MGLPLVDETRGFAPSSSSSSGSTRFRLGMARMKSLARCAFFFFLLIPSPMLISWLLGVLEGPSPPQGLFKKSNEMPKILTFVLRLFNYAKMYN